MKNLFVISIFLIMSSFLHAQDLTEYKIDGKITGLKKGEKVVMVLQTSDFPIMYRTDSCYVTNNEGEIHILGHVPEGPRLYWLVFETHNYKKLVLVVDNNQNVSITCNANIDALPPTVGTINRYTSIKGSTTNDDFWALNSARILYLRSINRIAGQINQIPLDSFENNKRTIESLLLCQDLIGQSFLQDIVWENPSNSSIPIIMDVIRFLGCRGAFLKDVCDTLLSFNPNLVNTYFGRRFSLESKLCVGQPFPIFSLPTTDGTILNLENTIKNNKVTLINFWSWNSYEVDKRLEEVKLYYEKYNGKGLKVIGVYTDTDSRKWKISSLDLPWNTVSDLKGKNGIVRTKYLEHAGTATTNVLIDSSGKIIAWDVSGILLKYYLWKYLKE